MKDVEKEFNNMWKEDVEEYNSRQTRKNLKIDNYFQKLKSNKKNEPVKEMIVQIGNKDNMGRDKPENREKSEKVLLEFYKNFEQNYPDLKILGAVLHVDEASPHLHVILTPYTENHGKNGLRHKQAWDEAYKNMGFKPEHSLLNKTEKKPIIFNGFRNHLQKVLDEAMNEQGFKREDQYVTHDHMSVKDYKEWSDIKEQQEQQLNSLSQQKTDIQEAIDEEFKKFGEQMVEKEATEKNKVDKEVEEYKKNEINKANKEIKDKKQELLDKLPDNVLNFLYFTRNVVLHIFSKIEGNKEIEDKLDEAVHEADPGNQLGVYDNYNPITQQYDTPDNEDTDEEMD